MIARVRGSRWRAIVAGAVGAVAAYGTAMAYPAYPFVYQNLFKAASALVDEMNKASAPGCLSEAEKAIFSKRVARLEQEIDQQLNVRPDAYELYSGAGNYPTPMHQIGGGPSGGEPGDPAGAVPMAGGAAGTAPRYVFRQIKTALDQTLSRIEELPNCSEVPELDTPYQDHPMSNGAFGGAEFVYSGSGVFTNEDLATTLMQTSALKDSGNGFGGGINFGYNYRPWLNSVVVGVVVDADFLHDRVNHNFAGGTFIGSTVDFAASADVRAGVLATRSLLLYGQTGVSVADQRLQISFGGPVTDTSKFTPGINLGGGVEWILPTNPFPAIGRSTSLFIAYEHTWWDKASLNTPAASPLFNYTWQRQSDEVKAGIRIEFGPSPPRASAPSYPVKAPIIAK
jgi:hypothetical protein